MSDRQQVQSHQTRMLVASLVSKCLGPEFVELPFRQKEYKWGPGEGTQKFWGVSNGSDISLEFLKIFKYFNKRNVFSQPLK